MPPNFMGRLMSSNWHAQETYKSMISISVEGFKLLALLNGGAAAGMLAAFQNLAKSIPPSKLQISIGFFAAGLVFVGVAFLFSYLTQNRLFEEAMGRKKEGAHRCSLVLAFASCVLSLLCFLGGAGVSVMGLETGEGSVIAPGQIAPPQAPLGGPTTK